MHKKNQCHRATAEVRKGHPGRRTRFGSCTKFTKIEQEEEMAQRQHIVRLSVNTGLAQTTKLRSFSC